MSKKPVSVIQEIHEKQRADRKEKFANSAFVLTLKGIWTFAEGASLLVTSGFSLYQAYNHALPTWGQYILIVSGVLVLVPAALLLSKFFRNAARA